MFRKVLFPYKVGNLFLKGKKLKVSHISMNFISYKNMYLFPLKIKAEISAFVIITIIWCCSNWEINTRIWNWRLLIADFFCVDIWHTKYLHAAPKNKFTLWNKQIPALKKQIYVLKNNSRFEKTNSRLKKRTYSCHENKFFLFLLAKYQANLFFH